MVLDVSQVQAALRDARLDGWLLYDFRGSNPIARRLAGLDGSGKMATRRWYYLIPPSGEPRKLVHAIERHNLDDLPGNTAVYAGHASLDRELAALMDGRRRVAMEYSPNNAIPYVSRVDAGTVEQLRSFGVEIVSSGDLVQQFEARWTPAGLQSHREASEILYRVKDEAFETIARALRDGRSLTEYELQQQMAASITSAGLFAEDEPVVGAGAHSGDPHWQPSPTEARVIGANELILLDLWGKQTIPGAAYADITWVGFTGDRVPDEMTRAFDAIVRARDAAIALAQDGLAAGRDVRGCDVDRAARDVLEEAGYGAYIAHRTGHSLGEHLHGNSANMDDYETHDDRRLLPETGFTVEPGLYFETFGVRTEINVYIQGRDALVTGPRQARIIRVGFES